MGIKNYSIILLEIVISLTIGVLTSFWLKDKASFLVGIITFLLIESIKLGVEIRSISYKISFIYELRKSLQVNNKFSELALIYGFRQTSKIIQGEVMVWGDDVHDLWKDCVNRIENSWITISYTHPDYSWKAKGWAKFSLALQKEKIDNGCSVERIFCVDDLNEKKNLENTFEEQSRIGVKVFWILKDELLRIPSTKKYFAKYNGIDFGIIDNSLILKPILDNKRKFIGATIQNNFNKIKSASKIFKELKEYSTQIEFGFVKSS